MTTLTNDFHNTSVKTRLTRKQLHDMLRVLLTGDGEEYRRAKATQRRIWKALCGIEGCTCGNDFGERPSRDE
jgi:hypothetical protein